MITLADAEEAPEGHHGVGDLTGNLVDHEIVHRAEVLARKVIHRRADDLVGGDKAVRFVGSDWAARRSSRRTYSVSCLSMLCLGHKNDSKDLEVPKNWRL
jgi:hypothetical protein